MLIRSAFSCQELTLCGLNAPLKSGSATLARWQRMSRLGVRVVVEIVWTAIGGMWGGLPRGVCSILRSLYAVFKRQL
jgi:hypothetical protein